MAWRLLFLKKKLIGISIIKISHLLWNPKLLPCSQGLSVRPWPGPVRSNSHAHVMFFRLILILYSHLFLTLPTGVLPPRFSHFTLTFILYVNCQRFSWCLSGFLDNKEVIMFPLFSVPSDSMATLDTITCASCSDPTTKYFSLFCCFENTFFLLYVHNWNESWLISAYEI